MEDDPRVKRKRESPSVMKVDDSQLFTLFVDVSLQLIPTI